MAACKARHQDLLRRRPVTVQAQRGRRTPAAAQYPNRQTGALPPACISWVQGDAYDTTGWSAWGGSTSTCCWGWLAWCAG